MPTINKKVCTGPCKEKLEATPENFQRDSRRSDGLRARCKECSKSYVASHEVGRSTLYNDKGEVVREWVKTKANEADAKAAMFEALKDLDKAWDKPKAIKKPKGYSDTDLLNTIVLGDPHFGQHSWGKETGQDFNLEIAEKNMFAAVDRLVGLAPRAKHGLLVSVGDYFHADSSSNQTTAGTKVDVDTRWAKVLRVGIRAMRRAIDRMLETHDHVTVICALGNHDTHTSAMLALALEQFYENEPRVTVDTTPGKFHYFVHGQVLIGVTHGDTVKAKDLGSVMAVDRAKDWGNTKHRYWLTGHIHHDTVKELSGVIVESFRTLAPSDAWHKGQGYRSGQDLKLDTYHKDYGRVNRHIVGINQIWDLS